MRGHRTRIGSVVFAILAAGCGKTAGPGRPEEIMTEGGIAMIAIRAGEFILGEGGEEEDEKPAHAVRIAAFHMDKTEVTQQAFARLMGRNPSKFKGPEHPVERVRWVDAVKFCNMRSLREGLEPCYDPETFACDFDAGGYRLPTEAEWEYACRAGTATRYAFGDDPAELARYGWYKENAGETTHPVSRRKPNAWGLLDMHGNVWEWCNDFYGESAYQREDGEDPRGPEGGDERVLRGGSWRAGAGRCRSAARSSETPAFADACFGAETYGFRCVRRAPSDGTRED